MRVMEEVRISLMTLDDLEEVHAIEARSYPYPWTLNIFRSELSQPNTRIYIVARLAGKIVGYAGMILSDSEGHITNLAVDTPHRHRRIGMLLALRLIEMAMLKGLHWLTLEVRETNLAAQELYRGFGFRSVGLRKKYYSDGENAVIMWTDDIASPEFRKAIQETKEQLRQDK